MQRTKYITTIENLILLFGIFLIPIGLIIPATIISERRLIIGNLDIYDINNFTLAFRLIVFTSIIVSLISVSILEVKKIAKKNHKFAIPALVLMLWFLLYLPFGVKLLFYYLMFL